MRKLLALLLVATPAHADTEISVGGYLEALYQAHFQNPSNRVTNLRGFDNRSRTFTLSNVALDAKGERGPVTARIVLQIGATPSTYYLAEPAHDGTGSTNATDGELWKYIQTASVAALLPKDLTLEAGLLVSPIGIELLAIKDNWNWSRSNLFFGLPFYHTGVTLARPFADGWTAKLHAYNGWNSVVDNNDSPSVAVSASYTSLETTAQVLYFGGIERDDAWRHLVDVTVQRTVTDDVTLAAQADAGSERTDAGRSWWAAAAIYGRVTFSKQVFVALRGDYFRERVAEDDGMRAAPIFWPTKWMASGTATLGYQPTDNVSLRFEYRHDHADSDVFFGGDVATDPMTMQAVANRETQDTATVGVTAWF